MVISISLIVTCEDYYEWCNYVRSIGIFVSRNELTTYRPCRHVNVRVQESSDTYLPTYLKDKFLETKWNLCFREHTM